MEKCEIKIYVAAKTIPFISAVALFISSAEQ